ncbi:DNA-dependent ATPase MGS1 [Candida viswanathii]|uniref:DNA-dependent ATPase MGS1 n=1 Tax=Candida viswanathii TaxID=5486 RepID=A0A367XN27_9ASCO|nr:DNA-dependent ATPase MGS1 [Candida viswanathii]
MEDNDYTQATFRTRVETSTLYEAIRPTTFAEYVGQGHLINAQNGSIYTFIKLGYLPSMIFLGAPGVGKTALASVISYECKLPFIELSATTLTTEELRQIAGMHEKQIVVFIDEIHRLTKVQQDWLLPYVENGEMILIGATTSHPSKRIRHAILSRCHVFHLHKLSPAELQIILEKAIRYQNLKREHVLGLPHVVYDQTCEDLIFDQAHGDSRIAINLVELISNYYGEGDRVEPVHLKESVLKRILSNMTYTFTGETIKNQDIFIRFMDVLKHGCTPSFQSSLFYDNPLEFFYDRFKSKEADSDYIHQMQVSDDSDVEDGELYSDCESEDVPAIDDMNDADDFQLVAVLYYLNLLLQKGESPIAIFRCLILFAIKYTACDNFTFGKFRAFKKSIDNRNDGNVINILSNCVEWLMYTPRSSAGIHLAALLKELTDYFRCRDLDNQLGEASININTVEISFDENEVHEVETYPEFSQSHESQIKGFEVTYDDSFELMSS